MADTKKTVGPFVWAGGAVFVPGLCMLCSYPVFEGEGNVVFEHPGKARFRWGFNIEGTINLLGRTQAHKEGRKKPC